MTDSILLLLGHAPATGGDAVTQCNGFKALMRNEIGRDPDGAWLRTIVNEGRCMGMAVEYCPDIAGAFEWAKKAQERAETVWEMIIGNQKPHEHIITRSRGA